MFRGGSKTQPFEKTYIFMVKVKYHFDSSEMTRTFHNYTQNLGNNTVWKVCVFRVILVRIFPYSDWIREDTSYLSVFSPNAGKCWPEKLRIRILFTQCNLLLLATNIVDPKNYFVRVLDSALFTLLWCKIFRIIFPFSKKMLVIGVVNGYNSLIYVLTGESQEAIIWLESSVPKLVSNSYFNGVNMKQLNSTTVLELL